MDATQQLMADLDNPLKFERVVGVPVFVAHEREFPEVKLPNGSTLPARRVKVTDRDLYQMADRLNHEIARTGQLRPLTVGHRQFSPGFPEQHQAPLVGFARNYRVERVERPEGSFLALVEDEFILRDHTDALRQYPYRSIDYDPDTKTSEGTALLLRPPFLKMGTTLVYQAPAMRTHAVPTTTATPDANHEGIMAYMRACPGMSYEQAAAAVSAAPRDRRRETAVYAVVAHAVQGDPHAVPPLHTEVLTRMRAEHTAGRSCSYEDARSYVLANY